MIDVKSDDHRFNFHKVTYKQSWRLVIFTNPKVITKLRNNTFRVSFPRVYVCSNSFAVKMSQAVENARTPRKTWKYLNTRSVRVLIILGPAIAITTKRLSRVKVDPESEVLVKFRDQVPHNFIAGTFTSFESRRYKQGCPTSGTALLQ